MLRKVTPRAAMWAGLNNSKRRARRAGEAGPKETVEEFLARGGQVTTLAPQRTPDSADPLQIGFAWTTGDGGRKPALP